MQIRKSSLLKSAEQVNWLECSSDVHFPNCVKAPPSIQDGQESSLIAHYSFILSQNDLKFKLQQHDNEYFVVQHSFRIFL